MVGPSAASTTVGNDSVTRTHGVEGAEDGASEGPGGLLVQLDRDPADGPFLGLRKSMLRVWSAGVCWGWSK
jgi:hypothetical protein